MMTTKLFCKHDWQSCINGLQTRIEIRGDKPLTLTMICKDQNIERVKVPFTVRNISESDRQWLATITEHERGAEQGVLVIEGNKLQPSGVPKGGKAGGVTGDLTVASDTPFFEGNKLQPSGVPKGGDTPFFEGNKLQPSGVPKGGDTPFFKGNNYRYIISRGVYLEEPEKDYTGYFWYKPETETLCSGELPKRVFYIKVEFEPAIMGQKSYYGYACSECGLDRCPIF
jgi:hypothetical protein